MGNFCLEFRRRIRQETTTRLRLNNAAHTNIIMKDGKLIYSLHIHVDLFTVRYHPTRPCCKDLCKLQSSSLAFKAILTRYFFLSFFLFFPRVLEHIKETSLDRFGEKKTSSFGVNSCNKILVMTFLLHYFHFVRLLSNSVPKITKNYEI